MAACYARLQFGVRGLPKRIVRAMYRDLGKLGTLAAVGRKWDRCAGTIKIVLQKHGLYTPDPLKSARSKSVPRQANGSPVRYRKITEVELREMICGMTRVYVPEALRREWRDWDMDRRREFIVRVRAHLQSPKDRPRSSFSKNVVPFDYWTPEAQEMVKRANAGVPSRLWRVRLFPCSQGVIYAGKLWFWQSNWPCQGGAYYEGVWTEEHGRPALHHRIWCEENGAVEVPAHHIVQCVDGNVNNLDPANLVLKSRADHGREGRAVQRMNRSRSLTAVLMKRFERRKENQNEGGLCVEQLRKRKSKAVESNASDHTGVNGKGAGKYRGDKESAGVAG